MSPFEPIALVVEDDEMQREMVAMLLEESEMGRSSGVELPAADHPANVECKVRGPEKPVVRLRLKLATGQKARACHCFMELFLSV